MINAVVLDILIRRILNGGLNPKTGQPMQIADLNEPYKTAVENEILMRQGVI